MPNEQESTDSPHHLLGTDLSIPSLGQSERRGIAHNRPNDAPLGTQTQHLDT